jgi:transcriptional regulator with XRE-family HTH domain
VKTKLQELRIQRKKLLQDVSDYTGINRQTLSNYERGDREPNIDTLKLLASFYEVSIDELLDFDPSKYNENIELIKGESFYPKLRTLIDSSNLKRINVYSLDFKLPQNSQGNKCVDVEDVPSDWFIEKKEYIGLRIDDETFNPLFRSGDNVIVQIVSIFDQHDILVIKIDSKIEFCKFFFYRNKPLLHMIRDNRFFDIKTLGTRVEIIGKVIQLRRMTIKEIQNDPIQIKFEQMENYYSVTHCKASDDFRNIDQRKKANRE